MTTPPSLHPTFHFQRVYIEISNICNLQCSFCPEVQRTKKKISPQDFEWILQRVKGHTNEITMHLMGEPLAHPDFPELFELVNLHKIPLQLTTNALLLNKYEQLFLTPSSLRQINFSLQSFLDNFPQKDPTTYIHKLLLFAENASRLNPELFINFRLWNLLDTDAIPEKLKPILDQISSFFKVRLPEQIRVKEKKSWKLSHKIRIHWDTRFDWPALKSNATPTNGFCHGLSQQIGILTDGTVVPCCLDNEGCINLGNILKSDLKEIINSDKAQKIILSFQRKIALEPLCKSCSFKNRFNKKT